MRFRVHSAFGLFLLFSALFFGSVGCDTMPGVENLDAVAPVVTPGTAFVAPEVIDTDLLTFENGSATTEVTLHLRVEDADGDVKTVFAVIQSPVVGAEPAGELEQTVAGNGDLTLKVPFTLREGASGTYQVVVFASDTRERISNRIFGSLIVTAGSEPPVIDEIDIPTTITRPAEGEPALVIPIVVHASDPDGLDNILGIDMIVNAAATLRMCDDGGVGVCNAGAGSSGDVLAGDGKFTVTIQLESRNQPGQYVFEFTAIDRSGLRSAQVARIITVN